MSAKGYTTEAKIENFLNKSITTGQADDYILATEKLIDNFTGKNFVADIVASERKFNGCGGRNILIDDCIEITKVERGLDEYGDSEEEISAGGYDGYFLFPNNYEEKGYPINEVHLRARNWIKGIQNNTITAKWGYSETVPDDVSFSATIIASGMYNYNRGGGAGSVKSEKIGNYSVSYQDEEGWDEFNKAKLILNNYRKWNL